MKFSNNTLMYLAYALIAFFFIILMMQNISFQASVIEGFTKNRRRRNSDSNSSNDDPDSNDNDYNSNNDNDSSDNYNDFDDGEESNLKKKCGKNIKCMQKQNKELLDYIKSYASKNKNRINKDYSIKVTSDLNNVLKSLYKNIKQYEQYPNSSYLNTLLSDIDNLNFFSTEDDINKIINNIKVNDSKSYSNWGGDKKKNSRDSSWF